MGDGEGEGDPGAVDGEKFRHGGEIMTMTDIFYGRGLIKDIISISVS